MQTHVKPPHKQIEMCERENGKKNEISVLKTKLYYKGKKWNCVSWIDTVIASSHASHFYLKTFTWGKTKNIFPRIHMSSFCMQ